MIQDVNILASMAMLKVEHKDDRHDYLDYYRNFVLYALECKQREMVSPDNIQEDLKDLFALSIPLQIISILLKKMSDNLSFCQEDGLYHYISPNGFNPKKFESQYALSKCQIDRLSDTFINYYESYSGVKISNDNAVCLIISFLKKFSANILPAYYNGNITGSIFGKDIPTDSREILYFCKFIEDIKNDNIALFNDFIELVKGCLLSNAIFVQDDDNQHKNKFSLVTFYLDAPLLIRLYGLEGELKQKAISETIELVQALGGKFATFSHCCDEFFAIVSRAIRALKHEIRGRGPVYEEVTSPFSKWDETELTLIKSNFSSFLSNRHITYRQTPEYRKDYQIDETKLGEIINSKISYYHDAQNPDDYSRAILNDINSIRSIYAIRGDVEPRQIENAIAIFLTHNKALADAAAAFRNAQSEFYVKTTMTDVALAYYAWLKSPQASSQLPEKEILSYVRAAITPNDDKWYSYISEIENLKSDGNLTTEEYFDARYSLSAAASVAIHDGEMSKKDIEKILKKKEVFQKSAFQREISPIKIENKNLRSYIETKNQKRAARIAMILSIAVIIMVCSVLTTVFYYFKGGVWGALITASVSILLIPFGKRIFVHGPILKLLLEKYNRELEEWSKNGK